MQPRTMLYHTITYFTMQCYAITYFTMQFYAMLWIRCNTLQSMQYHIIGCNILDHAIPHNVMQYHDWPPLFCFLCLSRSPTLAPEIGAIVIPRHKTGAASHTFTHFVEKSTNTSVKGMDTGKTHRLQNHYVMHAELLTNTLLNYDGTYFCDSEQSELGPE